eukprot:3186520-Rhodomonas_salina.4
MELEQAILQHCLVLPQCEHFLQSDDPEESDLPGVVQKGHGHVHLTMHSLAVVQPAIMQKLKAIMHTLDCSL